jgi:hypothetical protein
MLKVYIHAGDLKGRNAGNQLAVLDIAYAKCEALADYIVALSLKEVGEVAPDMVTSYPRWAGSLWDLVARALTRVLYRADQAPPTRRPDKRCAYATRLCVAIQRATLDGSGVELGTAEIAQVEGCRGTYVARFEEDIMGVHVATFSYGLKSLNPVDLALRAMCWALYNKDVLGRMPSLILPPTMSVEGVDRFHIEALTEPAKTGFQRYRGACFPTTHAPDPLPKAEDYVKFLMRG